MSDKIYYDPRTLKFNSSDMDMIAAINTGKVQFEFEIYTTNQQ